MSGSFRRHRDMQLVFFIDILPADATRCDNRTVGDACGADQTTLPSKKNWFLLQKYALWNIANQRCGRLILMRRIVEVDVGGSNFAMILPAGAARHEYITEIDQATQCDERQ